MFNRGTNPKCPLCAKPAKSAFLKVDAYTYYRCGNCTAIFVDPVKEQDFYLGTETYLHHIKQYISHINPYGQRWMIEQFDRLHEKTMQTDQKGSFFEIGAGAGFLTLFALARGWQASGIETSKVAVKFARESLKVDISLSTIERYKVNEKYDSVAMVEVLEHFLDPYEAVNSIKKFAKSQTFLFGTTPNTDSEHWKKSEQNIYVPDDHIILFNEKSIRAFAKKAGVTNLTVEFFGAGEKHDSNLMYAGVISGPSE